MKKERIEPECPNLGDITKVDWNNVRTPDVLCGGFPCQDISVAGKGAGIKEGTRSGLWSEFAKAIRILRPRYVVVENVPMLVKLGLHIVLADLAEAGYDAEWHNISACMQGAPHTRERLFIMAYSRNNRRDISLHSECRYCNHQWQKKKEMQERGNIQLDTSEGSWWAVEPRMDRVADGIPSQVDRIKCLGNAVVPQVAQVVGEMILEMEKKKED